MAESRRDKTRNDIIINEYICGSLNVTTAGDKMRELIKDGLVKLKA